MTQVKKVMKEPPHFDDIGLDPITYLRWIQMLEEYLRPKDALIKKASS